MKNKFIVFKKSKIHNQGGFAKRDIRKKTKVIEYIGEIISKEESEVRADKQLKKAKKENCGSVYIFELNKKFDIDGNVSWNPARLLNHSCNPNCEVEIEKNRIWVIALRKIKKDEEITYNYGYDSDDFKDHKCKCGSENCFGYIVAEEHWKKLERLKKKKSKAKKKSKKKVRKK